VSEQEHNEYMKDVRWTTAIYAAISAISVIVAIIWFCSDIKASIKDTGVTANMHLTAAVTSINRKQDSLQHLNDLQFMAIWDEINSNSGTTVKRNNARAMTPAKPFSPNGCVIERYINGHLTFVPIKCP
jgi:hypothetical protein